MGWDGPWRDVIEPAAESLLARGRTDDGDWIFAFDGAGQPSDRRLDAYTQAFAIFGLAHAAAQAYPGRADLVVGRVIQDARSAGPGAFGEHPSGGLSRG